MIRSEPCYALMHFSHYRLFIIKEISAIVTGQLSPAIKPMKGKTLRIQSNP